MFQYMQENYSTANLKLKVAKNEASQVKRSWEIKGPFGPPNQNKKSKLFNNYPAFTNFVKNII